MMILHPQLEKDCIVVGQFDLCVLLLMNDRNYPWFILVPQREGVTEIHQLSEADQQLLIRESSKLSQAIAEIFDADKINIAALGNMVPQLHIHHVVRYKDDPAWPAPIWGVVPAKTYAKNEIESMLDKIRERNILG
ncbi:MAG: HIT domain-containing protein [Mariprofundaceae bacterium]